MSKSDLPKPLHPAHTKRVAPKKQAGEDLSEGQMENIGALQMPERLREALQNGRLVTKDSKTSDRFL